MATRRNALAVTSALALGLCAVPAARGCEFSSSACPISVTPPAQREARESSGQPSGGGGREQSWVATVRIGAPADQVWSVLTDFENWPEFFPGVARLAVTPVGDQRLAIRQLSKSFGYEIAYTTLTTVDSGRLRLEQTLDPESENDVEKAQFVWQLIPINDSRSTVAVLRSNFASGKPVPGFVERRLLRRGIVDSVEALAAEVERRVDEPLLALAN